MAAADHESGSVKYKIWNKTWKVQAENQYNIHIENLWTPTAVEKDNNKLTK